MMKQFWLFFENYKIPKENIVWHISTLLFIALILTILQVNIHIFLMQQPQKIPAITEAICITNSTIVSLILVPYLVIRVIIPLFVPRKYRKRGKMK